MQLIVDVQGYKKNGKFVCKELAFCSLEGQSLGHYIFETPLNLREYSKDNAWVIVNHHQLPFICGVTPYCKIVEILQSAIEGTYVILVKGTEKKRWVEDLLPQPIPVVELASLPPLKSKNYSSHTRCSRNHHNCALENVLKLAHYLNYSCDPSFWETS